MKNLSRKITITLVVILSFFISTNYSLALNEQIQKPVIAKNTNKASSRIIDPDLNLSIEELKKKYPIYWLEKKYGNYKECINLESDVEDENFTMSKNLTCSFVGFLRAFGTDKERLEIYKNKETLIYKKINFRDFSENEIRSAFVNDPKNVGNILDPRLDDVIVITFKYFEDKADANLTSKERKLKQFIKSEKIISNLNKLKRCTYITHLFYLKENTCNSIKTN